MRRIKAVVYGVGSMGSVATRMMLEKGVDIVGALARSPEKVGHDLGEVAGLGFETGVTVEDDPDRVLSSPEVAKDQRVDTSVEDFDRWLAEADRPPSFGRNTLGALVEDLGLSVAAQESTTRPEAAKEPVSSKSLGITVETGRVIGFTDVDT